jgi:hypothetical protein
MGSSCYVNNAFTTERLSNASNVLHFLLLGSQHEDPVVVAHGIEMHVLGDLNNNFCSCCSSKLLQALCSNGF